MKYFDSIVDALREVRSRAQGLEDSEQVYLFIDYWKESFYVTDNSFDIAEKIEQDYFENACEPSPETLAEECIVIEYALASRKESYPSLYRAAKSPVFKSEVKLIRMNIQIEPEYSLSFNIG